MKEELLEALYVSQGTRMKDYLGNSLGIGDNCVMIEPHYRNFITATIVKFTPENIRLEYSRNNRSHHILQAPSQLIKIIKEAA